MRMHIQLFHLPIVLGTALIMSILLPSAVSAGESGPTQTLQDQLDATREGFAQRMPPEVIQNVEAAVKEVADTGILDRALKVDDHAPDFMLPDATGTNVELSSLLKQGPVVLTWYRGNW